MLRASHQVASVVIDNECQKQKIVKQSSEVNKSAQYSRVSVLRHIWDLGFSNYWMFNKKYRITPSKKHLTYTKKIKLLYALVVCMYARTYIHIRIQ